MVIEFLKMVLSFLSVIQVLNRNVNFFSMPELVNLVVLNCIASGNVTVLEHLTHNPKIKGLSQATELARRLDTYNDTQRNDTQHNDTQHNDTQNNETKHNDTRHDNTQHDDTQHDDTQHDDTQHNDTQHNDAQHNGIQQSINKT
jgi:hypothetical protein